MVEALGRAGQSGPPPAIGPAPEMVEAAAPTGGLADSAVLVALFEEHGETRVLLTRRSGELRSHTGQVSFPGGRVDPGETAVAAALREAAEEVALDPALVRPVGWLHPLTTFASGSHIVPVVGVLPGRPDLVANPREVARIFDVGLWELAADGVFAEERWRIPERPMPGSADGSFAVRFFEVATETVWGATARLLTELLALAFGVA